MSLSHSLASQLHRNLAEALPEDMGCPAEPMDILQYLGEVGGMPNTQLVYHADPLLRLRALAALAWIFFRQYFWSPYPDCFEALTAARVFKQCVYHSEVLAVSDFIPPIVLRIAGWLSTVKVRYAKLDGRVIDEDFRTAEEFWTVYEEHVEDQKIAEQKRLAKVAKAPNQYRCAADGCGIQAVNKCALRKCGGDCPPDRKPHYCSAECQAKVSGAPILFLFRVWAIAELVSQHWFVHRSVCRGSDYADIAEDDGDLAWEDVEVYRPRSSTEAMLDARAVWADQEGPEIFIDIPNISIYRNEVFRIRTKTMSPAFLKSYRALWRTRSRRVRQVLQRSKWIISFHYSHA